MLHLLKDQKIGQRHSRAGARRERRRRPTGRLRAFFAPLGRRLSGASFILPAAVRRVCGRNRYLLITALSLVCILSTGIVFSVVLQGSLTPVRPVAAAPEEDVSVQALAAAYEELGSGTHSSVRERDVEYVLQEGDSLYSIGRLYVIKPQELKDYNKIADPNRLRAGAVIVIPSRDNLARWNAEQDRLRRAAKKAAPASLPLPPSLIPAEVAISAATEKDGPIVKAHFTVAGALPEEGIRYQWDLGDGGVSHLRNATYNYLNPGTYNVTLTLRDRFGYERRTNTLTLEVSHTEGASLVRTLYLTVPAVGETFALAGKVTQMEDFLGRTDTPVRFVEERDGQFIYRALEAGNYSLIARGADVVYKVYLFVSPFPSVQNDRFDIDWYRTQYNTGFSNCGPSAVSMAVGWARGAYVSVSAVRGFVGWQGDGGTSFVQLENALKWKGVRSQAVDIAGIEDVFAVIDRGEIAIILFHTAKISRTAGRPELNYVGRYYSDLVGHYVIVKGYSTDRKYFVVYDPLPSDWAANGNRYGDGVSMIGRNRYYPVAEMARALSLKKILTVSR